MNNIYDDENQRQPLDTQDKGHNSVDAIHPDKEETNQHSANMEAYHPHVNHPKRKLKDFIIEFVMIFIAITGGFFMENMRESIIDHHKEKAYITSLTKDIREDTTQISNALKQSERQIKGIDSLLNILETPIPEIKPNELYKFTFQYLNGYHFVDIRNIAITQLKSTGNFRLINKMVADSVISYYSNFDARQAQKDYNLKSMTEILNIEIELLDLRIIRNESAKNQKFTINNPHKLGEFYNRILMFRWEVNDDINWLKTFHQQGISLLKYLNTEYSGL